MSGAPLVVKVLDLRRKRGGELGRVKSRDLGHAGLALQQAARTMNTCMNTSMNTLPWQHCAKRVPRTLTLLVRQNDGNRSL